MLENNFKKVIEKIKEELNNTQYEIFRSANMSLLKLYYNLGKIISENKRLFSKKFKKYCF